MITKGQQQPDGEGGQRRRSAGATRRSAARLRGIGKRHLWRRIARGTLLFAAVFALAWGGIMWRLSQGPIPISFLTERIEAAVQEQLPRGFAAKISDTVFERHPESGEMFLGLREVTVLDPQGSALFAAPRAAIGFSKLELLTGQVAPRSVWLIEPTITLVETGTGLRLKSMMAGQGAMPDIADRAPIEALAGLLAIVDAGGFSSIGVRRGDVVVERLDGGSRKLDDFGIGIFGNGGAGALMFRASLGTGPDAPRFGGQLRREADGDLVVRSRFDDLAMPQIAALLPSEPVVTFSNPVSGEVAMRLGADGDLEAAGGRLSVAAGQVGFGEWQGRLDEAEIAFDWNDATGQFSILPSTIIAGHNRATVSGQIAVPDRGDFTYGTVPMRLELTDVRFGDPEGNRAAVYPSVSVEAFYVTAQKIMHVSRLDIAAADAAMSLVGLIGAGGESPSIRLAGTMLPMPFEALKDLWPPFLGPNTRNWVIEHLDAGQISDARLTVNIGPGMLASAMRGVPLPESAYLIEFGLDDVVFSYLGDMPPISGADGRARLTPGTFDLRMREGAEIRLAGGDTVEVGRGRFHVADRRVKPAIGDISLQLTGGTSAMLRLFDREPLKIATRRGIDPAKFGGEGRFDINLSVPLMKGVRMSDVRLGLAGSVEDFNAREFSGAREVSDGQIEVRIADGRFAITGQALLDGVPAEIAMEDSLDGSGAGSAQSVTLKLDEEARGRLGIPLGDIVTGPMTATVSDVEATASGTSQRIEADLTEAKISFAPLGLAKPAGERASATFLLSKEGDIVRLSEIRMESSGIRIEGEAEFDSAGGGLISLDLPVVRTARGTDVSVTGRSEAGREVYSLTGAALDMRPSLRNLTGTARAAAVVEAAVGPQAARVMQIDIGVDTALGFNGQELTGVSARIEHAGGSVRRLDLSGQTAAGRLATARYSDSGATAEVAIASEDGGRLLAWSGVYPNMRGGRLSLTASRPGAAAPMAGQLVIRGFEVANDRSLARLIESGESGVGRADPASAGMDLSNVGFDTLSVPFVRSDSGVAVHEGVLRGPAVGATIEGSIDFAGDRLALHGTYVPLYALNNLFGQLPILGPLLGGKRNEGLLGITYSLSGPVKQPVLTVNPLSVVAPGVFRYILGMDNPRAFTPPAGGAYTAQPIR